MRYACLLILGLALTACGADGDESEYRRSLNNGGATEDEIPCTNSIATGAGVAEIQAAFIDAQAGSVICFAPGTYALNQEISLAVSGVTLRGQRDHSAIFDFKTAAAGAQGLSVRANDFVAEHLAIKNTKGDGIRIESSTNVHVRNVRVSWDNPTTGAPNYSGEVNGGYGIYPISCTNVLVEDSEVVGSSDAGIYVGQSRNIIIRNNYVHGNVAGMEVENCIGSDVYGNEATNNTGGILVFDLPGLQLVNGHTAWVHDNLVYDNNHPNFAPTGVVRSVPPGTGVMLLSAKDTIVSDNLIRGNGSTGVLIVSYASLAAFTGGGGAQPAEYDAWSYDVYVHSNTMEINGANPGGLFVTAGLALVVQQLNGGAPLDSVLWDGFGRNGTTDNATQGDNRVCVKDNTDSTTRNLNIAALSVWLANGDLEAPLPPLPQDQADLNCELNAHTAITL